MNDVTAPLLHRPADVKPSSDGGIAGRGADDDRTASLRVREAGDGSRGGTVTKIPPQAREGLMRTWLAILAERHPSVACGAITDDTSAPAADPTAASSETPSLGKPQPARNGNRLAS